MSYYVHDLPGRLRVKTPHIKRNPVEVEKVKRMLESLDGTVLVLVNPLTGSITVTYDEAVLSSHAILDALEKRGYIDRGRTVSHGEYLDAAIEKAGETVRKALLGMVLDKALAGTPLALLTVFV